MTITLFMHQRLNDDQSLRFNSVPGEVQIRVTVLPGSEGGTRNLGGVIKGMALV